MKLSALLSKIDPAAPGGDEFSRPLGLKDDPNIGSIHYRAQDVEPGGLFVAIEGLSVDGHDYIDAALERGAVAVVVQKNVAAEAAVIPVQNTRRTLAALSAAFYGHPSRRMTVVGITGTNGKTTVAYLLESILQAAGKAAGVIGTINYRYAGKSFDSPVTTPESLDLQRILSDMAAAGVTHAVLEVSSHALDQHRVADCAFDAAAFTNLTQDHLDYHGDMTAYWDAKKRLFTDMLPAAPKGSRAVAIINCNSPYGRQLNQSVSVRRLTTGHGVGNAVRWSNDRRPVGQTTGRLITPAGDIAITSPLVGRHNEENLMVAAGLALALDLSPDAIKSGIEAVDRVPGRLEPVSDPGGRRVYVDYAHTPDALKNVLVSLRGTAERDLICVFGCGGDRDRAKRPRMGTIAGQHCDLVLLTSDNPRSEEPGAIIAQIEAGMKALNLPKLGPSDVHLEGLRPGYRVIPDRRSAIETAVEISKPGDIVLIAGKGHETYQILRNRTIEFDDRQVAEAALHARRPQRFAPAAGHRATVPQTKDPLSWRLTDVLTVTGGTRHGDAPLVDFAGIGIDSRTIGVNDLFVALQGDTHDGHSFIDSVIEQGVKAVMLETAKAEQLPLNRWIEAGTVCITVSDTIRALGDLARFHRRRCGTSVVAITGSNGKTTTRELTAAVVRQRHATLSSRKNFNNLIGVPLTLFDLTLDHQWLVIELGMNAFGEIDRLGEICMPDIGLITNIGPAHLAGVGSLDGVMRAKGELLGRVKPGGVAVLNADDPRQQPLAEAYGGPVVLYGRDGRAPVRAVDIRIDKGRPRFTLTLPGTKVDIRLNIPGTFMVANALAAAAVGACLEFDGEDIKKGLESVAPVYGRMNLIQTANGITIIDDTYNANPGSMAAALESFSQLKQSHRGIAIVGDMYELGEKAAAHHRDIGAHAARADLALLMATGEHAQAVADGARRAGMPPADVITGSKAELLSTAAAWLQPNDWVLVKGSRAMAMETIVAGIRQWAETGLLD